MCFIAGAVVEGHCGSRPICRDVMTGQRAALNILESLFSL